MNKESIMHIVIGLIIGIIITLFFQFNARLMTQGNRLDQLEQANGVNTQTVTEVVNFLNGSAQQQEGTASTTPTN